MSQDKDDLIFERIERALASMAVPQTHRLLKDYLRIGSEYSPDELRRLILWHRCLSSVPEDRAEELCGCIFHRMIGFFQQIEDAAYPSDAWDPANVRLYFHLVSSELARTMESRCAFESPDYWMDLVEHFGRQSESLTRQWYPVCVDVHLHLARVGSRLPARTVRDALREMADRLGNHECLDLELRSESDFLLISDRRGAAWAHDEEACLQRILDHQVEDCPECQTSLVKAMTAKIGMSIRAGDADQAITVWRQMVPRSCPFPESRDAIYCLQVSACNLMNVFSSLLQWEEAFAVLRFARRVRLQDPPQDRVIALYLETLGEVLSLASRTGRRLRLSREIYDSVKYGSLGPESKEQFLLLMQQWTSDRALEK